ncbi:MAG TPA: Mur ligase domain-containing protein [Puia sp.]|nr:Mur ligase domain-containing protein [Puia sp.]
MAELKNIKKIYFIGIGGIGMSALARYFRSQGVAVSGYDRTETALTRQLAEEGIAVHYADDPAMAPKDAELIVYTPAMPKDHKELNYYLANGYEVLKRSDVLGEITRSSFNICVAGTHGKTTITTMIAHILRHSGYGCNAFLGGIAVNYNSNFWSDPRNVCVVEADEYDRSFLKLTPDIAVITSMDADHLDIYGTAEEVQRAFIEFSGKLKPGGLLLNKRGLERSAELNGDHHLEYGLEDQARPSAGDRSFAGDHPPTGDDPSATGAYASGIGMIRGGYEFGVKMEAAATGAVLWALEKIALNMGGMHNVENVTAAICVAHQLGIGDEKIREAVAAFRGVRRRFEYVIRKQGLVFIDDYAHHPEELKALISGAKGLFGGMKCTVIFQPHLFSRTRDFADGFAASLNLADEVFLLPIYPARELPVEGVSSDMIAARMDAGKAVVCTKHEILEILKTRMQGKGGDGKARGSAVGQGSGAERGDGDTPNGGLELLITAGAGDIDALVGPVREILERPAGTGDN